MRTRELLPVAVGLVALFLAGPAIAASVPAPVADTSSGSAAPGPSPAERAPIEFEGFGFDDFEGAGSIASALEKSDLRPPELPAPVWLTVKGPTAPDQVTNPLQAEFKGRFEGIDLSAGVLADRTVIQAGPTKLVGAMAMAHDHRGGRESIELRTSIAQSTTAARIALELGPRIERRLPGGLTLFVDGKAEAQSAPPQATTWQPLTGPAFDGVGIIGLTGRTGLMR